MQEVEWVVWGQHCEWRLISVQSGEVQMYQLCWEMAPIVAEWSSFLWDTSSLLFHVLKALFRCDHLDRNQYNRGWGQTSKITPSVPLRPGLVISPVIQETNPFRSDCTRSYVVQFSITGLTSLHTNKMYVMSNIPKMKLGSPLAP